MKDTAKVHVNATVNIGMITMFAITETIFKFWKKNAIINIRDIVAARLIATLEAIVLLKCSFWVSILYIGLYNIAMPITQPKLIRKLTSKTQSGFNKYINMPAMEIEQKLSYSVPNISDSNNMVAIILALIMEYE